MAQTVPQVVLVGRINAGKSTLFNKLAERGIALVSDIPGTTRDSNYARIDWRQASFTLVDTGGLDAATLGTVEIQVQERAYRAIKQATLIVLVVDGLGMVTSADREIAKFLRRTAAPTILVATKLDGPRKRRSVSPELYSLGLGEPHLVSGVSGAGTGDLLDAIVRQLPKGKRRAVPEPESSIRISIIGKTNVGKSSLFNALIGDERMIVAPEPHTTREPQDTTMTYHGTRITLVDTAGLRRTKHRRTALEAVSAKRTEDMISHSDICWLVTDISESLSAQDHAIAELARASQNGIIVVANKWDKVSDKTPTTIDEHEKRYRQYFTGMDWAPLMVVSALHHQRLRQLMDLTLKVHEARQRRLTDTQLQRILSDHAPRKAAPRKGTKSATELELHQTGITPPTFSLKARHTERIHTAYLNQVERALRTHYDFVGTPIIMNMHKKR